jgi:hypothetical protein
VTATASAKRATPLIKAPRCEWCEAPAQAGKPTCRPCEADLSASEAEGEEVLASDLDAEKVLGWRR